SPRWIWIGPRPKADQTVYFRKEFEVPKGPLLGARLTGACDNQMTVFLNGERVAVGKSWETPTFADLTGRIKPGRNVLAIEAKNQDGAAGLLLRLVLEHRRQPIA